MGCYYVPTGKIVTLPCAADHTFFALGMIDDLSKVALEVHSSCLAPFLDLSVFTSC